MKFAPTPEQYKEAEKLLYEAKLKWDAFFKRHGFSNGSELHDPPAIAFARVVEREWELANNQVPPVLLGFVETIS